MDTLATLNLVGASPVFNQAMTLLRKYAQCDATVLIQGETGTGKELAARALHYFSGRRDLPFIPVNCGALPDTLIESELFGHERGAFTDAREARDGLVTAAAGGTLFLDELEALSPRGQVVLLRFLQDRSYRRVGGRRQVVSAARVVAASNCDLEEMVRKGCFRIDLLYRLSALVVGLPPLRERRDDIALLANAFLDRLCADHGRPAMSIGREYLARLQAQVWPGNVRELENVILRAFLLSDGVELGLERFGVPQADVESASSPQHGNLNLRDAKATAIRRFERGYLDDLLTRSAGNMSVAARLASQDRGSLNRLVRKHGIDPDAYRRRPALA